MEVCYTSEEYDPGEVILCCELQSAECNWADVPTAFVI